jgi:transcriptional antiterminator RfaH
MMDDLKDSWDAGKKRWYVAFTKARHEETAQYFLNLKGLDVFYPKLLLPFANRGGRQILPLFPNYIFVHIDIASREYSQVLWCRGIKRFISFGDRPASVEDSVIKFMRDQANEDGLIAARSNVKVGDEVRITNGPFKGLVGIIQEPPDAKCRVKVLMAILSRQVQVQVPAEYLDNGWVVPCTV